MHDAVGADRDNVFLGKRLDAVGNGLQNSERSHAIWPETILHPSEALALEQRGDGEERRKHGEDAHHRQHRACERLKS